MESPESKAGKSSENKLSYACGNRCEFVIRNDRVVVDLSRPQNGTGFCLRSTVISFPAFYARKEKIWPCAHFNKKKNIAAKNNIIELVIYLKISYLQISFVLH